MTKCKAGQLAVIVESYAGNHGVILKCLRRATKAEIEKYHPIWKGQIVWVTDATLNTTNGVVTEFFPDSRLQPIVSCGYTPVESSVLRKIEAKLAKVSRKLNQLSKA